jgi:hypothetical protein
MLKLLIKTLKLLLIIIKLLLVIQMLLIVALQKLRLITIVMLQLPVIVNQTIILHILLLQQFLDLIQLRRSYLTNLVHLLQLLQFLLTDNLIILLIVQRFRSVLVRVVGGVRRVKLVLRVDLVGRAALLEFGVVVLFYIKMLRLVFRMGQ